EPIHYLARKGAKVDMEGACALGDLETVKRLFPEATMEKRLLGLCWACRYGHADVVDYLLGAGVPLNASVNGNTPLHAAAFGGQLQLVKQLLDKGAPMEALNHFGGTVLGQTL